MADEQLSPSLLYQMVAQRRLQHDLLLWQAPTLGLTAQAFLMSIALGHDSARTSRAVAATLGIIATLLSMQLMARLRWHETAERAWLVEAERAAGLQSIHAPQKDFAERMGTAPPHRPASWRAYAVWQTGLATFGVMSVLILLITLIEPNLLTT